LVSVPETFIPPILAVNDFNFHSAYNNVDFMFLENVERALLMKTSICLLMAEPAGDAEIFAGGFDEVGGGE
jgi:hypothetical protein